MYVQPESMTHIRDPIGAACSIIVCTSLLWVRPPSLTDTGELHNISRVVLKVAHQMVITPPPHPRPTTHTYTHTHTHTHTSQNYWA